MEVGPTGYYIGGGTSETSFADSFMKHIKKIKVPDEVHAKIKKAVKALKRENHTFIQNSENTAFWATKCIKHPKSCKRILKYAEI